MKPLVQVNPGNTERLRQAIEQQALRGSFSPAVYVLEPVSSCNLACVMCPNRLMDPSTLGSIDVRTFENIIDNIAPYAEFLMLYWMGEPLLHAEFCHLLSYARRNVKGTIVLSSNMTSLRAELVESIVSNVDILLCCIDRWDKRAFEKVRLGANFENVVRNVEAVLAARPPGSSLDIVVKALDLGNSPQEFQRLREYWEPRGATCHLAWLNDWAGQFPSLLNASKVVAPPLQHKKRSACLDLWFKMVINWRGEVAMCCFDWEYKTLLGTFDGGTTIQEIWQGPAICKLREMHVKGKYRDHERCSTCKTWGEVDELNAYLNPSKESYGLIF